MNTLLLKIFFRTLSILMVLVIVLFAAIYYLLNSQGGAEFVLNQARNYLQENYSVSFNYTTLTGTLAQGLSFKSLQISNEQFSLQTQSFASRWSLWPLLNRNIELEQLHVDGLNALINLADAQDDTESVGLEQQLQSLFALPYSLTLESLELSNSAIQFDGQEYQVEQLNLYAVLDSQSLQLDQVLFRGFGAEVEGAASLQADDFLLNGNIDWRLADSSAPTLQNTEAPNGSLVFNGDITALELSHTLNQPLVVNSEGSLTTGLLDETGLNFNFEHQFDDLISLLPEQDMITSISGDILTHGSPSLVFLDATLNVNSERLAPLSVLVSGEYSEQQITFESLQVSSPEIDLEAIAELSLQPFNLTMEWGLNQLDVNDYLSGINLNEVMAGGSLDLDENNNANVDLAFLSARLNGYPLEANGSLELNDNSLSNVDLSINAGINQLQLQGTLTDTIDVNWLLDAPDLSVWLPTLNGQVFGEGVVEGDTRNPVINGSLDAESLSFEQQGNLYQLESLSSSIDTSEGNYRFEFMLSELNATINSRVFNISDAQISFNGLPEDHRLNFTITSPQADVQASLEGAYANTSWQGSILTADAEGDYGDWVLREAINVQAAADTVSISAHCWNYLSSNICIDGNLANDVYSLNVGLEALPLGYFNSDNMVVRADDADLSQMYQGKPEALRQIQQSSNLYLPQDTYIRGLLFADLHAQGNITNLVESDFSLAIQPDEIKLNLLRTDTDNTQTQQTELRTFTLSHRDLQVSRNTGTVNGSGELSIIYHESSGLDVQGDLAAEINLYRDQSLQGNMDLNFSSLDWVETLLPDLRDTRGEFSGNIEVLGSLDEPILLADLSLTNASFEYPEYGIRPEQIELTFSSNDNDNVFVTASAVSGEGNLSFNGNAHNLFDLERSFELTFSGENFRLINNPNTQMNISPDLEISLQDNRLDLSGVITVPELIIDIRESDTVLLNNTVEVTRDAVIINAPPEQAYLLRNQQRQTIQEIPVTADLQLLLGDNVHFTGFGLDLLLDGNLQVQQDEDRPLLTYGDISIRQGYYEIYGQRLDINNGKLIFFGNPTNPALDIRAYRESEGVQAGVQINGTLRNMQSYLFSTPSLPESEILSILITGKSFGDTDNQDQNILLGAVTSLGINQSQGIVNIIRSELGLDTFEINSEANLEQSSLGVGKYLTPDLFMHYEIGLSEKQSVLSLDYILSERLKLEVESGISQSIDMTYKIEK